MENISNNINNLYNKSTYLERYGLDLIISIIVFIIFFILFSYFYVMNNLDPIKADWQNNKCKPSVIPFAGIIMNPDNESSFSYTQTNFNGCVNNILSSITNYAFLPIYYTMNAFTEVFTELSDEMQSIRAMLNNMRNSVTDITSDAMSRILNILIPIQKLMINVNDMFGKTIGVMTASTYTLFGTYYNMVSFVGSVYQIIVDILIALAVAIAILWIVPFTWPAAATMTTAFIAISIPLAVISIFMSEIFNLHPASIPSVPSHHCFSKNTMIELNNGEKIKISKAKLNDVLSDGSTITGIMKMANNNQSMYKLNEIIVTHNHQIYHKSMGWINVEQHPNAIKLESFTEPYLYCISTDNKLIIIDDYIFSDWDELDENDINEIKYNANYILPTMYDNSCIHKYLDGGLSGETMIELENGNSTKLKNIKVNDILKFGEIVLGIIKIDASNLSNVKRYEFDGVEIIGGPNIYLYTNNLGIIDTTKYHNDSEKINTKILYHLVTDKKKFYVNGLTIGDYNSCIEKFLNNEKDAIFRTIIS